MTFAQPGPLAFLLCLMSARWGTWAATDQAWGLLVAWDGRTDRKPGSASEKEAGSVGPEGAKGGGSGTGPSLTRYARTTRSADVVVATVRVSMQRPSP
jgi:hypothetical protein